MGVVGSDSASVAAAGGMSTVDALLRVVCFRFCVSSDSLGAWVSGGGGGGNGL